MLSSTELPSSSAAADKNPTAAAATAPVSSSSSPSSSWRNLCQRMNGKKFRITFVIFIWGLFTGVERVVVMPTLWLYFTTKFDSSTAHNYYGLTLAAFNLCVLLCSPVYGYLASRGVSVKALLLFSNMMEISGNIVYFVSNEPWLILMGRCIAGVGAGSEVPLSADIVRLTTPAERTSYIVALLIGKQFGLIVGPACTLFLYRLKMDMGQVHVNVYNAPGLLMALLWAGHTLLALFLYEKVDPPETAEGENTSSLQQQLKSSETTRLTQTRWFDWRVLVLLAMSYAGYMNLMSLEAVLSPTVLRDFQWTEVETSEVYLVCGVFVIVVYALVHWLSSRVMDKHLMSFGVAMMLLAYSQMGIAFAVLSPESSRTLLMSLMLVGIAMHVVGQPFFIATNESLYSKSVPLQRMDTGQSALRTVNNAAFLLGPLLGGLLTTTPYWVFACMTLFMAVPAVFFWIRYAEFSIQYG